MKTGRHEHRHEFGAEKEQEERVHHEGQREGGVGHLQEQAGRQADGVPEAASDTPPPPQASYQFPLQVSASFQNSTL